MEYEENLFPASVDEAIAIQNELRARVRIEDDHGAIRTVAGIDAGYDNEAGLARAAIVVIELPGLNAVAYTTATRPVSFPYVPGLLGFREAPAILDALKQLPFTPDLLVCDGHGIAHPRRLGIAAHVGVLTGIPAIGVAKKKLTGWHPPLGDEAGSCVPLTVQKEHVGFVLRSRTGVKPIYVSPGHRISVESALALIRACLTRYRLPEPTRLAHNLASNQVKPAIQTSLFDQD